MSSRLIDPTQDVDRHITETLGSESQRAILTRIDEGRRGVAAPKRTYGHAWPFYRANIGGLGDVVHPMAMGTPSSLTAWAATEGVLMPMPSAGVVTGGAIWSTAARTAGTATLWVRIASGASYSAMQSCALDGTNMSAISILLPDSTIRFGKGETLEAFISTSGWTPTTADVGALVFVEYDVD